MAGGGTVSFVNNESEDFVKDTEERERAGTPGVLQTLRASLALELKGSIGIQRIETREQCFLKVAFEKWSKHERIEILGPPLEKERIAIISFNIKGPDRKWIHPKLVAKLLNDLFGIQSRAGCSCAGPYGHKLLGVDACMSNTLRKHINDGFGGLKLGWCRIGFHFIHDEHEIEFICNAVLFLAEYGVLFIPLYEFDVSSGSWTFKKETISSLQPHNHVSKFGIAEAIKTSAKNQTAVPLSTKMRCELYRSYLKQATRYVDTLKQHVVQEKKPGNLSEGSDPIEFAANWYYLPPQTV